MSGSLFLPAHKGHMNAEIKVICLYGEALFSLLPQYKGFQQPPIFGLLPANTNARKSPFKKKGQVGGALTLKVKLQVTINAQGCVRASFHRIEAN